MVKIKNLCRLLLITLISVMLLGCSVNEVIRVGTPFNDKRGEGVDFHTEVTDREAITKVRTIINSLEEIEEPHYLKDIPDAFISLDRLAESVSEIRRYIWYQDDGSAILNVDGGSKFYNMTKQQHNELKRILEES
uniref:Lipoprotein n=1 Tax=Anaerobacillus isosaccharinicus TaxID=1532552 RepID=A0A1S2LV71_9BACI